MSFASRFTLFFLSAFCFVALAPSAPAQKVSKKYFEQSEYGFRFKPMDGYELVPPQSREKEGGLLAKASGKNFSVPMDGFGTINLDGAFELLRMVEKKQRIFEDGEDGMSVTYKYQRLGLGNYLSQHYGNVKADKPSMDKQEKIRKGLMARHRQWTAKAMGSVPLILDAWTFDLNDAHVHLVNVVPEKHAKKWLKAFKKSAKTFQFIERTEAKKLSDDMSYEDLLDFHDNNERATGGWRAVATPSKRYIIKTDSDDDDFIAKAIARLEKSRDLYERDFPPAEPITHVSIVRVCSTEEVFHSYGNTGGGVGGWFSPATTELVIYDGKNRDRNATYAVMSHEAFHQYCHFLFQESAAHRWFDEGHGDYYGGAKMGRSKQAPMKITPKMPAGFGRLGIIREMVRTTTYAPLEDHLNYNHRQWQSQGPTNVSCYAQSWSIIYMLRQGALGKVPKKVWKKEYADIIPNYIRVLNEEFTKAYAEARAEKRKSIEALEKTKRRKKGKKGKKDKDSDEKSKEDNFDDIIDAILDDVTNGDLNIDHETKLEIWKTAMAASWGDIDMLEFEENWTTYVKKFLK